MQAASLSCFEIVMFQIYIKSSGVRAEGDVVIEVWVIHMLRDGRDDNDYTVG